MTEPSPPTPAPDPWRPLLTGEPAAEAVQTALEIADALAAAPANGASLAAGDAGRALLFAYLAQHAGEGPRAEAWGERAADLVATAVDAVAAQPLPAPLYAGFSGIAWAVEHLQPILFADGEDANADIDAALLTFLDGEGWAGEYDLIGGLTGLGVYALERVGRPTGRALLERVVARLAELAETGPEGATWFSAPERLPAWQRDLHPTGFYNLGVAHGVPGVIGLLGRAAAPGVEAAGARPLLDAAVRWLLARRQAAGSVSCFGTWYLPGVPGEGDAQSEAQSRLAWCYGDPGIAATLHLAARRVGEPAWESAALSIARAAAARPESTAGVRDAGLCHGAAGLAHLFNRLYQASGEEALAAAARFWIERTLSLRQPGRGVAGFLAWRQDKGDGEPKWASEPGFLEGGAGIGLALLAAASPVDPAWDRVMLLS